MLREALQVACRRCKVYHFPFRTYVVDKTTVGVSSGALGHTIINSERGASRASASTFSSIMEEGGLSLDTYILKLFRPVNHNDAGA